MRNVGMVQPRNIAMCCYCIVDGITYREIADRFGLKYPQSVKWMIRRDTERLSRHFMMRGLIYRYSAYKKITNAAKP